MINKVQNSNQAFTSKVNMTRQTAKTLNLQPKEVKEAFIKDIEKLRKNGHSDKVTISFKEQPSRSLSWAARNFCQDKFLKVDVVEKRGSEYFASDAEKLITPFNDAYNKSLDVLDLYRTARGNMKPYDKVNNKFMEFV